MGSSMFVPEVSILEENGSVTIMNKYVNPTRFKGRAVRKIRWQTHRPLIE
jgi:hypothetical protein